MTRTAATAAVTAAAVVLIWLAIRAGWADGPDTALMQALHGAEPGGGWRAITRMGDTVVRFAVAVMIAVMLWARGRKRDGAFVATAVAGGALFNEMLKMLADRARPDLLPALDTVHGTSFPSGHAAGALVLAGAIAMIVPSRWRWAAVAVAAPFAIAVGISRVALGVHWPSDVVAGWLAGATWLALMRAAFGRPPAATRRP